MSHSNRAGASLLELIVAIALIAVLAGLLLAAVQRVRAVAARASCANNVKQIALALHAYHDAEGQLPPSVRSRPAGNEPYLSWRVRITPYLEQQSIWQQTVETYQSHPDPFYDPAHVGRETVLKVYACPSDDRLRMAWNVPRPSNRVVRTALSSYLGVSGTDSRRADGIFFVDSRIRLVDIVDGASQTLLIGERPPSRDLIYGWWYAGSGQGSGVFDSHLGVADRNRVGTGYHGCPRGPYNFRAGDTQEDCATFHFWSPHPGGANFAFADGSVRFLRYSADSIMPELATRAGGEAVSVPD